MNRVKYPRTFHLPWSEGRSDDDKVLQSIKQFEGRKVVATLKMDGENTTIYSDGYLHARSIDSRSHPTQDWCRQLAASVCADIPAGWRICGENLFAKHSIAYNQLLSYFYLFSAWNDENLCLSWNDTIDCAEIMNLTTVPVIYLGQWNPDAIKAAFLPFQKKHEGYVVRLTDSFHYDQFQDSVAKYVRANHVQTSEHWKHQKIVKNELA